MVHLLPPAGIIIDRMRHRDVIIIADAIRVFTYATVALAILVNLPLSPAHQAGIGYDGLFVLVVICAVIIGAPEVLRDIAAQPYLPALVSARQLEYANSWLQPVELVSNLLVGTAVAGILIGISIALPFAVNAGLLLLAIVLIASISRSLKVNKNDNPQQNSDWRRELREGIAFQFSHKILLRFALIYGINNFAFFGTLVTLVLIVQERLLFGPLAMSAILASGAAGGILAGVVNEWLLRRFGRGRTLQAGLVSVVIFPITVLLSEPGGAGLALICFGFFISEFWGVTGGTISVSYRQRHIPPHLLGRVISVYRLILRGGAPLGILTAGGLITVAENLYGRDFALIVPYGFSILIYIVVAAASWRFRSHAFDTR